MFYKSGIELTSNELNEIIENFVMSNHSIDMMEKRLGFIKIGDLKNLLKSNILAYWNTNGSVNIAIDKYHYFVFVKDSVSDVWVMITYKETSWFGNDIYYKQKLAKMGIDRKER